VTVNELLLSFRVLFIEFFWLLQSDVVREPVEKIVEAGHFCFGLEKGSVTN
jgi:hypothetical protein